MTCRRGTSSSAEATAQRMWHGRDARMATGLLHLRQHILPEMRVAHHPQLEYKL